MDTKVIEESTFADFRMRFSVCVEDIKYVKTRQWTVTYYLMLIFAAIISFVGVREKLSDELRIAFLLITEILVGIGTAFLWEFHKALGKYRKRLACDILPNLTPKFQMYESKGHRERLKGKKKAKWRKKYYSLWNGLPWTITFISLFWLGLWFIYWQLFKSCFVRYTWDHLFSSLPYFFHEIVKLIFVT